MKLRDRLPKHRRLLKRRAESNEQGPELTRIQQISASANDIPKKVDAETRLAGVITGTVRQIFRAATKVKTNSFRFESLPAEGRQGCQTDGESVLLDPIAPALCRRRKKRATSIDDSTNHSRGPADQDQA